MEHPHLVQNLPHTVKHPLSVTFCGMGFYNASTREAAHGNTSTTLRLAHQIERPKNPKPNQNKPSPKKTTKKHQNPSMYWFYTVYSVQSLQEDRTQHPPSFSIRKK